MSDAEPIVDLTTEERDALEALPRERAPGVGLEARTVAALRQAGLLATGDASRPRWRSGLLLLAASLLLVAIGFFVGRLPVETTEMASLGKGERYLLVLFRSADELDDPAGEPERVGEYAAWARSLAREGHFLGGDPLSPDGRLLVPTGDGVESRPQISLAGEDPMTGYFLITADNDDEAEEIARRCPHLAHGGKVMVRRLGHD